MFLSESNDIAEVKCHIFKKNENRYVFNCLMDKGKNLLKLFFAKLFFAKIPATMFANEILIAST